MTAVIRYGYLHHFFFLPLVVLHIHGRETLAPSKYVYSSLLLRFRLNKTVSIVQLRDSTLSCGSDLLMKNYGLFLYLVNRKKHIL